MCSFCFVAVDSLEGGRGKGFKEAWPEIPQKTQYPFTLVFCSSLNTTRVQMSDPMGKQIKASCPHLEDKLMMRNSVGAFFG